MVRCVLTFHEAQTSAVLIRKWQWSSSVCSQKSYLNTEVFHCHASNPHLEAQPMEWGTLQEQSSLAAPREGAEFLSDMTVIAVTVKPRHTARWLYNTESNLCWDLQWNPCWGMCCDRSSSCRPSMYTDRTPTAVEVVWVFFPFTHYINANPMKSILQPTFQWRFKVYCTSKQGYSRVLKPIQLSTWTVFALLKYLWCLDKYHHGTGPKDLSEKLGVRIYSGILIWIKFSSRLIKPCSISLWALVKTKVAFIWSHLLYFQSKFNRTIIKDKLILEFDSRIEMELS